MNIDILYNNAIGRCLMKVIQNSGAVKLTAKFLNSGLSRLMIAGYIEKNRIDMKPFEGQTYDSFASFFSRKKDDFYCETNPDTIISPCDGLLSMYPITSGMIIPMKGSHYRLTDVIPDEETAQQYKGGLCMVFRLQASDYHHFCSFDDLTLKETHFIPGKLHSVQPIACETVPVYRLNRRWWSILDTDHFGQAIQVEVGAMMVGGVAFEREKGSFQKGEEMGCFVLAGSTIMLFVNSSARERLEFIEPFTDAMNGEKEVPVTMRETIGRLK